MATEAQIIANRRNAQKSTGPRTREGRAIISQNAVKHGLTSSQDDRLGEESRSRIIFSENKADFELYRDRILTELASVGAMESMLAERVVSLSWRLKRAGSIQNQAIDAMNENNKTNPLAKLAQSMFLKSAGQSQGKSSEPNGELALGRMAIKDFANARVLERLLMYERRVEHSLYRTILELQRLQLMRKMDKLRAEDEEDSYADLLASQSRASQLS